MHVELGFERQLQNQLFKTTAPMTTTDTATQLCEPSATIPLPQSHIHRTRSELQLTEDLVLAEARDMIMFDRLIRGIRKKSFEYSNKLSSALDRELLAQQTMATLEKLIQRKQELIYPTCHSSHNRLSTKRSNALTYISVTGVQGDTAQKGDSSSSNPEEIFDLDF